MLEVLLLCFERKGIKFPPFGVLKRMWCWEKLKRGSLGVVTYLRTHAPETARLRATRRSGYFLLSGVLASKMGERKIPITPKTVSEQLMNAPAFMDQQFPGYAESGLLEWVFRPKP